MRRALLVITATLASGLRLPSANGAWPGPDAERAESVRIIQGPALESATDRLAIIRWTTDNPGGTDLHYAVAHYGKDPQSLNQVSRSPNRRNRNHATMTFRVRLDRLKPGTTYYYYVESVQADGTPDGVKSPVNQFTTREQPANHLIPPERP